MRSLNLDQLRTLVEVINLGNFSAAGRRLNLTQPAVSLHIRELEQRYGVQLIERLGKQAHPTAPGREMAEHAARIFRECEIVDETMHRFRDGWLGRVHIGTTLTALTYQLPVVIRKLRTDHPGIDLLITNMSTRDSVENIAKNAIDIALVTLPVKAPFLRHAAAARDAGGDPAGKHKRRSGCGDAGLRRAAITRTGAHARRCACAGHAMARRPDAAQKPADGDRHGGSDEDHCRAGPRNVDRA